MEGIAAWFDTHDGLDPLGADRFEGESEDEGLGGRLDGELDGAVADLVADVDPFSSRGATCLHLPAHRYLASMISRTGMAGVSMTKG